MRLLSAEYSWEYSRLWAAVLQSKPDTVNILIVYVMDDVDLMWLIIFLSKAIASPL